MPLIHASDIYVPIRLREETYGNIEELAESMVALGQLQAILVEPVDPTRHPGADGQEWALVDGGRRLQAIHLLIEKGQTPLGIEKPGFVEATTRGATDDPIDALKLEYYANHYREDFSWKETANFYRRVHEILVERQGSGWNVLLTAGFLGVTERTVYRYLELTEDEELSSDPSVANAESFTEAHRKLKIKKETRRRKERVALREKREESQGVTEADFYSAATKLITQADCRRWIKTFEDDSVDFVHWDPPYGGNQAGGAMTTHEEIDDTPEYAQSLMMDMIPEVARVLHPGGWFVVWFHQSQRQFLLDLLKANGFWVNPYECIWYKVDRVADGHEITKYLTNAYEPFFLCGLEDKDFPLVLNDSSPQNVFTYPLVRKAARRHLMHKPFELLAAIIKICTVPGEYILDPSCGSGSIVKAALSVGRSIQACEISETYYLASVDATAKYLRDTGRVGKAEANDEEEPSLDEPISI